MLLIYYCFITLFKQLLVVCLSPGFTTPDADNLDFDLAIQSTKCLSKDLVLTPKFSPQYPKYFFGPCEYGSRVIQIEFWLIPYEKAEIFKVIICTIYFV